MNTTLTTTSRHDNQQSERSQHTVRKVALIDRIALHVGIALIKWGRRSTERRANQSELLILQLARENSIQRMEYDKAMQRLTGLHL